MKKKAQGLSITVIIVSVIAILVLVVLVLIFTGVISRQAPEITSCENKGGLCAFECGSETEGTLDYPTQLSNLDCQEKDGRAQICCSQVQI